MDKTKALIACTILILTSMASADILPATAISKGPRTGDLVVRFYANIETAYAALKGGAIDLIGNAGYAPYLSALGTLDGDGFLSADLVGDAQVDGNIVLGAVTACNTYQFDLNNNYSLQEFPGYTNPMSYVEMRQAVAWCTNKPLIVSVFCGGFAERIDQMIPAPLKGWAGPNYWYPNYPYEYNPASAAAVLDTKFPQGTTPNPYYDPTYAGSSPYIRTYPAGHEKAGADLDPLVFCVRIDDYRMSQAGEEIAGNMWRMGVPINIIEGTKTTLYDRVMGQFNYHLYTGSWDYPRFPPTALYNLYHSDFYYAFGRNYLTGISQSNPKYPLLDQYLEAGNYALTISDAIAGSKNVGSYMTIECVNVPLWSDLAYSGWSRKLLSVVCMEGYGPTNPYTFMLAYKADGTAIRLGVISPPNTVNSVYSSWSYDYEVLNLMTLYGGVDIPPYNLAADQPGFVKECTVGTWDDHGQTHTKVSMTFRSDDYFCQPVTGNQLSNVDADEYFFNAWYDYQVGNGWWSSGFKDLDHVVKTGTYSFDIYFNTASYFNLYYCQGSLRPMDVWGAQPELVTVSTETVEMAGPGYVPLANPPVWIVSATLEGAPLTPYVDYNIDADVPGSVGQLNLYSGSGTLVVTYWVVNDPRGFIPGNLAWQTMFTGAGMYYVTDYVMDYPTSEYAVFKRNPFYYMETPPWGDVDFVRKPNGAYKIDIYDVMFYAGTYDAHGTGVPSSNWFPAADVAPRGGIIDIFDFVTIMSNWDVEWDPPV